MALLAVLVNLPVVDLSVCYLPFVRGTVFCDVRKDELLSATHSEIHIAQ
ncbi:hypothetical protein T4A_14030 [Trichinella pseudospiralis]|uniref:Uncharacterized protein n=1 Tax=Trichinella pseudospiralis TaxID=6337 RepID=A0A0V1JVV2_TRIPS|nr:hypothetical protein T4E_4516 [Trichinella pseudospiralis]KRY67798.1 hypothetical protein T4A_14030 [Trichinella pseudospiralis]KRZ39032.1 hypothetical protein T4C_4264 [Trichinella pseudospiralis]